METGRGGDMSGPRRDRRHLFGFAFDRDPGPATTWPWMVVATFLAFVLRVYGHTRQAFWADEVESVKLVLQPGADPAYVIARNFHGPLHKLLVFLWSHLLGSSDGSFRMLSVVIGTATVPLIWAATRRWVGERPAVWAAFLLAINPFHIWYSQEVRGYGLLMGLGILCMWAFLAEVRDRSPRSSVLYFLSALGTAMASFGGLFLLTAQGLLTVIAAWRRDYPIRRYVVVMVLVLTCLIPYFMSFGETVEPERVLGVGEVTERTRLRGSHTFSPLGVGHSLYAYSVGLTLGPAINDMHRSLTFETFRPYVPVIAAATVVFGLLALLGLLRARGRPGLAGFLVIWLGVPILITYLLAVMNLKVYNIRYPAVGFGAWIIFLAIGTELLRPRAVKMLMAVLVVGLTALSLRGLHTEPRFWRPDVRSAAALIEREGQPSDRILLYTTPEPFIFYYQWRQKGEIEVRQMNAWHLRNRERMETFLGGASECDGRLWLVRYRSWYLDPREICKDWLDERLIHLASWQFDGLPVDLYECRPPGEPDPEEPSERDER